MIKQLIKRIITLNIIFVLINAIHRIIVTSYLIAFHYDLSYLKPYTTLIKAFCVGTIYDCIVIVCINYLVAICFIIFLIIDSRKLFIKFIKSLKYYYVLFWVLLSFLWCIDFSFYAYFNKHINCLLFEIFNHKISYLWYISKNEHFMFLVLLLIVITLNVGIFLISKYILERNLDKYIINKKNKYLFICLIIVVISFIGSINSIVNFSDRIIYFHKFISVNLKFGGYIGICDVIETNPVFTFYTIIKDRKNTNINWQERFSYDDKEISLAFKDFFDLDKVVLNNPIETLSKTTKYNKYIEEIKPNVIIIVMEALGLDFLQYNNEDLDLLGELKKHFDEDIVFYNCLYSYENTVSSIETMFTSMLKKPKESKFFTDNFETELYSDKFSYITKPYEDKNYITSNISVNTNIPINFNRRISDFLFDEQVYKNIFSILDSSSNSNPSFIFCLTTTNHEPYDLPYNYEIKEYKKDNKIKHVSNLEIAAYKYSCQQLGEFLTKLKKSKYADNTIVLAVGDHYKRKGKIADDLTLKSVPLYLYIPKKLKPAKEQIDTTIVVSHLDVMPTLYELSLSSVTYYSFGQSVFDKDYKTAMSSDYDRAIIVNKDDMCIYDVNDDIAEYYKLTREKGKFAKSIQTNSTPQHEKMLKQYKAGIVISEYVLDNAKKKDENNWLKGQKSY